MSFPQDTKLMEMHAALKVEDRYFRRYIYRTASLKYASVRGYSARDAGERFFCERARLRRQSEAN